MLRHPRLKLALLAATALAAGGAARAAMAAESQAPAPTGVAEIVVTAQKTAERVIDVPLNVSSLSGEALRTAHVDQPQDLASQVPNVDIKDNIPGAQSIITVRGVGLDDFSSTNNSSVGVYVDDVFLASFAEMDFNFYDLERIEVLKGPQGTLYGRNSTAGAINVISARPSLSGTSGVINIGYGSYRTFNADGYVNLPLSDTFALRLSAKTTQQEDGFWYSRVLHDRLGQQHVLLGRAQALWKPTDKLTVNFKLEGEHNRSSIGVGKFFGTIPTTAAACPDFSNPAHCVDQHGYTDATADPFTGDWNHRAPYNVSQWNATLHVDDDLGWAKLSSVTGYIDFRREFYIDADAAPTTDAEFDQNDKVRQFSQELRLSGKTGIAQWVVGGYYSWDRVQTHTPGFLTDLFVTDVLITADQTTRTGAVFGQVKWAITDKLSATTGLRYTDETRHYVGGTTDTNPLGFSFLCFVVGACGFPPNPGQYVITHQDASTSDRNWSWRAALDYKPTDDTLIYASISRGEKSGGFFNGISTNNAALAPFRPETLTDYEVGVKAQSADRRVRFGASVFYYDYHDLQTQTFTSVGAVSLIKLGNVPKAKIYGTDADLTWEALEGLTLRGGLGLLHTELGTFQTANSGGVVTVPAGNKLPDAPTLTVNGSVRYQHAISQGFTGAVQFDAHYSGSVFKEALNLPYLSAGSYWIENAQVSVSSARDAWTLAVWVKNLSNTHYVSQATDDGLGMGYRVFNPPRTYGMTVSHRFD
ncbi:MAG TPA: TonB-dependent receptor [Caulobacteraceae bacterium]